MEEIPISESNYPPEPLEPPDGAPPKKRRGGWPKGKPRGPRKPKVIEEPVERQEEAPTPSPAPPEPREPMVEATASPKPRRSRKGRKSKTGVMVGSEFYPCVSATYEPPWLKCYGGVNEVWVRVDRITTLASLGTPIEVPVPAVAGPRLIEPGETSTPQSSRFRLNEARSVPQAQRDAELAAFRRRMNGELEAAQSLPGGVPDAD